MNKGFERLEWNTVKYIDCMDEMEGLPSLKDKSIDLCFTDPNFNVKIGNNKKCNGSMTIRSWAIKYKDNMNDNEYSEWCKSWFQQLKRVCERIVIHCGMRNIHRWCIIEKPRGFAFVWKRNSCSPGHISNFLTLSPLIFYGKVIKKLRSREIFDYPAKLGFLSDGKYIHPCPLNEAFLLDLLTQLEPKNVLDIFMGSGTTAEVCTKLGIPWVGYEINEVYSQDIIKRLENCKKEANQMILEEWIK